VPRQTQGRGLNGSRLFNNLEGHERDRGIRKTSWGEVVVRQQISWMLFLSLVAVVSRASAQTGSPVPALEAIIARMAQARVENRARFRHYVVTRDYKLFGKERQNTKSQVTAEVTFVPPDSKKYAIQQSNGTRLGERIVRRMLESEAEIAKDYSSNDISPVNYDLRFIREENVGGQRCYVLELLPKRKDKNLVRGNIWVDARTYLLHRTEGQPAKRPSWWLRDVHLVFLYGDVEGMWLQTVSEATATVRILGQHTIVSQDVKYNVDELVAAGPQQASQVDIHGPVRHCVIPVPQSDWDGRRTRFAVILAWEDLLKANQARSVRVEY